MKKGRESAIKDFDSAISINPRLFAAYYDKGVVLESLLRPLKGDMTSRVNEVIACFRKAIDIGLNTGPSVELSVMQEGDGQYLGTGHPMLTMSRFGRYMIEHYMSVMMNTRRVVKLTDLVWCQNRNKQKSCSIQRQRQRTAQPVPPPRRLGRACLPLVVPASGCKRDGAEAESAQAPANALQWSGRGKLELSRVKQPVRRPYNHNTLAAEFAKIACFLLV